MLQNTPHPSCHNGLEVGMSSYLDMNDPKWQNHSFTYRELGILYSPEVVPAVASRRLKQWVTGNSRLLNSLLATGWTPEQRILTPRQVEQIVRVLGEL